MSIIMSIIIVCSMVTFVVLYVLKQAAAAGLWPYVYLVLQHVLQHPVRAVLPTLCVRRCLFRPVTAAV